MKTENSTKKLLRYKSRPRYFTALGVICTPHLPVDCDSTQIAFIIECVNGCEVHFCPWSQHMKDKRKCDNYVTKFENIFAQID